MMRHLRAAPLIAAVLALLVLPGCGRTPRPNVLLIVLDTLRADRLSCYGYDRPTSPNIDAFAKQGILYENAFSSCCWTLPSHASLFTGLHPEQAGATSETLSLPQDDTTLAETFRAAGYATGAFVCNSWVSRERGFAQGFDDYVEMWRKANEPAHRTPDQTLETVAVDRLSAWIADKTHGDKPFFAFVNLNGVHMPYQPREPYLSEFAGGKGYDPKRIERDAQITSWWSHLTGKLPLDQTDYHILGDLYDGEVGFADAQVGRLIEALEHDGIIDNTIVVLTADHGENLGEKGRIDHMMTMYDTTLHIPLVIRYPHAFAAGTRSRDLVSIIDVAPTLLDLCGLDDRMAYLNADSTGLASAGHAARTYVMAGNERPLSGIQLLQAHYPGYDWKRIDYRMRCLRTADRKLIWNPGRTDGPTVELYNLATDPGEDHDLADAKPDTERRLMGILAKAYGALGSSKKRPMFKSTDEETLKRLRALGYVK